MGSLFKRRKGFVFVLLVVTVFQTLISSFCASSNIKVYAAETANDKIQNNINLARGKSITEIDTTQITEEDLQIIGVFLSNFYEPWSTEVVDAENEEDIKKQQTDALVNTCNFDKDLADVLVQAVWEMSRQSAKPLYIGKMENDSNTVETVHAQLARSDSTKPVYYGQCNDTPLCSTKDSKWYLPAWAEANIYFNNSNHFNENGDCVATYFSFLDWFGGLNTCSTVGINQLASFFEDKDYRLCLYWKDKDKNVPVFDTRITGSENMGSNRGAYLTASSLMYLLINDELNYNNGVGSALMDCSLDTYNNKLNDEQKKEAIILNSRLYVDCFGNILVDTGISKYVLFPACANPYAWATTSDYSDVGKNINVVNLFALGEAASGNIRAVIENEKLTYYFKVYSGDNSLVNLDYWRVERNSTDTTLDKAKWHVGLGAGEDAYNAVINYTYKGSDTDNHVQFPNWLNYSAEFGRRSGNYSETLHGMSNLITDFIQIDSIGKFKTKDSPYSAFNKYSGGIFERLSNGDYRALGLTSGKFTSSLEAGHLNVPTGTQAKKYLTGIFCSYVLAYFNDDNKDAKYPVSYYFAKNQFPAVSDTEVDWGSINVSDDTINSEVKSMIYYFLHPTKGITYVATWFKNKVAGILVTWHEDMVGGSDTANSTGATKYLGFSGYVTLPTLSDIQWTAWLLNEYNSIVVYLIIIIFIILIAYCIVGSMTFQRAIIGTLLFGILAFFPPLFINASVNFLNNTCDRIYGDKFTYWAIVQHSSYLSELQKALDEADAGNSDSYLSFVFHQQDSVDTSNYTRIKLKWLSPKKISTTADVSEGISSVGGSYLVSNLLSGLVRSETSGESFSDNPTALYMYRDYADLYLYSTSAYNAGDWYDDSRLNVDEKDLEEYKSVGTNPLKYSGTDLKLWNVFSKKTDTSIEYTTPYWLSKGFLVNTGDTSYSVAYQDYSNRSYTYLLDSMAYSQIAKANKALLNGDITSKNLDVSNKFSDSSFGLGANNFTVTLSDFNTGLDLGDANRVDEDDTVLETKTGDFYYALYTESPFYFFTWNILDQQTSTEFGSSLNSSSTNEKLLDMYTMNNQQYFYNYNTNSGNGYGELRDFTNMHSLFYYVIPYLKACNEGVVRWGDLYGTFLYEDINITIDNATGEVRWNGNTGVPDFTETDENGNPKYTDEFIYKWWHNYNVERLFNTYSAWVDVMYSCDYAKAETISVSGKKFMVTDPLNPMSYCTVDNSGNITEGRMMIFSRSEMKYYGLSMKDLTTVEQKIINTQDAVYADLLQLMDYYNLGSNIDMNEVLTTASGMLTTFAFNKEFSQTSAFGTNFTLYPQSYELKAFSYDAYLRLILAESTGESLLNTTNNNSVKNDGTKSYYQRIVENSSLTTGIGFILLDIIAVYAIPALKLFFLIAIFFMSVLMIVAAAVKLEMNMVRTTWDALVAPLLKFLAVSLGLAWVVSLFMTDGNTAVTGRGGLTISLGDPAMVILVMIIINLAVLILYYKICKQCFKKLVEFAKAIGTSVGGAVAGTLGKVAGGLLAGKKISDSVARGTAKARGKSNQPSATTSSGTGNHSGSKFGSFAKGALFGKAASDVGDAVDKSESEAKLNKYNEKAASGVDDAVDKSKSEAKLDKYNEKAKSKMDKYTEKAEANEDKANRVNSSSDKIANIGKSDKEKADFLKNSHKDDLKRIKDERENLRTASKNSSIRGKTSNFVKDKKLLVASGYHKAAGVADKGFYSAKGSVKKGVSTSIHSARNSKAGKFIHADDKSRVERFKAKRDANLNKAIRHENKMARKNFGKSSSKGKAVSSNKQKSK